MLEKITEAPVTLVFLHGFLGRGEDWQKVINAMGEDYPCLTIDLIGHGKSRSTIVDQEDGFEQSHLHIKKILNLFHVKQFVLIGYSLGGRIALGYARTQQDTNLKGLVLVSSHIGLKTEQEKKVRYQHDLNWAQQFRTEEISQVLEKWYQQSVFADLSEQEKQRFITLRKENNGQYLADMLLSTSLSKQAHALSFLKKTSLPVHYSYGEYDTKFKALATSFSDLKNITIQPFANVGHNIPAKVPVKYAKTIIEFLKGF